MRILITGATGFVGRRMVRFLLQRVNAGQIACLVRPSANASEMLAIESLKSSGVSLIVGDLERPDVSGEPAPAFDLLIHLAAATSTSVPEAALRANDAGVDHLLDWIRPLSRGTRFIYAGTIGSMDRAGRCAGPLNEYSPCHPRTPYAVTKLRGEQIVRARAASDGFNWTILRFPTVYGPGQMRGGLFDRLAEMASNGSILGRIDWPGKTSVIHADDVARMIWTLGQDPRAADRLYCIASDESLSVGEIAREIGRAIGRPIRPIHLPAAAWGFIRGVAWNRLLLAILSRMPNSIWLPFWRLGLIADDGFWYDTGRLREIYRDPIMTVPEGLKQMLDECGAVADTSAGSAEIRQTAVGPAGMQG